MIKQILFDFDGVIIDSMPVRDFGFENMVAGHDPALIKQFLDYHRINAGLSRFAKIRYFHEQMLGSSITDEEVNRLTTEFSIIMKERLVTPEIIIQETVNFIKSIYKTIPLHIVSGSEENELNFLCKAHCLDGYFVSIEGSPTPKIELVKNIMKKYGYKQKETVLIGDSISDFDAADASDLEFYGYNNPEMETKGVDYITTFTSIPFQVVC